MFSAFLLGLEKLHWNNSRRLTSINLYLYSTNIHPGWMAIRIVLNLTTKMHSDFIKDITTLNNNSKAYIINRNWNYVRFMFYVTFFIFIILNFLREHKHIFAFSIVSVHWGGTGWWNPSLWKMKICLACIQYIPRNMHTVLLCFALL